MIDEYVNLLALSAVPKAMAMSEIQIATDADKALQSLRAAIRYNMWDCDLVKPYSNIKDGLTVAPQNIVLRGSRIVIPTSLLQKAIDLAHDTHQGLVETKALLREKVWFPGIDRLVKETIDRCIPCQAAGQPNPHEPLQMPVVRHPTMTLAKVHANIMVLFLLENTSWSLLIAIQNIQKWRLSDLRRHPVLVPSLTKFSQLMEFQSP